MKNKLKLSSSAKICLSGLLLVIVLEMAFDIFERVFGFYMLAINPFRPQVGRLWSEEEKDVAGAHQISTIVDALKPDSSMMTSIRDLEDLRSMLSRQESVTVSQEDFLRFYRTLPTEQARKIMDPLMLLDLYRMGTWQKVRLFPSGEQIGIYFLDGRDQMLMESYLNASIYQGPAEISGVGGQLGDDPKYAGRIVTASDFYSAYDRLAQSYRLQIMNDPYKLIQWGANLLRVGISPFVEKGTVAVAFEIMSDDRHKIYEMQASEIAAGYLIAEINALGTVPPLKLPTVLEANNE